MVRQHARTARAFERYQGFQHHLVAIGRAGCHRRLDHRVFTADLIGEHRHAKRLFHAICDVQIGQPRLDHHAVGAFGQIELDLAQRLFGVGRVHLVSLFVTLQQSAAAHRITERAIERRGVFGGIGHDLHIDMPRLFQRATDRGNTAVHHVRRRDDIRPGGGLVQALPDQHFDGFIVDDIAFAVDQAVLPVAGIRIERDIGQHADVIAAGVLDRADRAAHQVIGIERLAPVMAAAIGLRVGKQRQRRDARGHRQLRLLRNTIDRPARHAGQRADRHLLIVPFGHEQRPDQIGRGDFDFAVKRTAPRRGARAAQAYMGIVAHSAGLIGPAREGERIFRYEALAVSGSKTVAGTGISPGFPKTPQPFSLGNASNCCIFARNAATSCRSTCTWCGTKRIDSGSTGWPLRYNS